jgi:hypothetical protein
MGAMPAVLFLRKYRSETFHPAGLFELLSNKINYKLHNMNAFEQLMSDWRTRFEEMKVQWNLGKMDAADAFENQKSQLKSFIVQLKDQLDKGTELAEDQAKNLKAKLEELNVQLHLGKAETKEAFEEQRKKIEPALNELYTSAKAVSHAGYNQALNLFDVQADWFKTNLEIMQLKYSLAKMDAKEEADDLKKQLDQKLDELSERSKKWQAQVKDNMEEWTGMAQDNMEKLRDWLKGLGK